MVCVCVYMYGPRPVIRLWPASHNTRVQTYIYAHTKNQMELALFSTLLLGFILLVIEKFTESEAVLKVAAWDLIICALIAFYCMGHAVLIEVMVR